MRKIFAIATSEYRQVVLTKSFLLSMLFPFIVYGGMFFVGMLVGDQTDMRDRVLIVADRTGEVTDGLILENETRNRGESVIRDGKQAGPRFIIREYTGENLGSTKRLLVELSERVRAGDSFAFALVGADYLVVDGGPDDLLQYYSNSPTFERLPNWLWRSARDIIEEKRFTSSGYDQREINMLTSHNRMERFSLAEVDEDGNLIQPREENELAAFLIPFGLVMLIFISIQITTPILLNSVIEEKMQRISEVLLSSVTPLQLLWGKLTAGVAVGLTFCAVYLTSLSFSLRYFEKLEWVPEGTFIWFFAFTLVGMLAFGSLFAGVSSACQDLKDTQNFAGTIVLLLVMPMMLSIVTIESPDGAFAVTLSMIPPFSIMAMMSRIAVPPGPPEYQIFLSLGLNLCFTFIVVWASSRIFRIGILSQGKTPSWREMLRWIFQRG